MPAGRKKLGLFGNAKYSKPVFRHVTESVLEGVKKDIESLIRPPSKGNKHMRSGKSEDTIIKQATEHRTTKRVREIAFPHEDQQQNCYEFSRSTVSFSIPEVRRTNADPTLHKMPEKHSKNDGNREQSEHFAPQDIALQPSPADIHMLDRTTASDFGIQLPPTQPNKEQKCNDVNSQKKSLRFPPDPPLHKIVRNMLGAFPHLTLKNNEAMEYTDVAFNMVKNALKSQANTSFLKAQNDHDKTVVIPNPEFDKTAFQSMCNETMLFDLDKQTEADDDAWSTDSKKTNESPIDFDLNMPELSEPENIHRAFDELDQMYGGSSANSSLKIDDSFNFRFGKTFADHSQLEVTWKSPLKRGFEGSTSEFMSPMGNSPVREPESSLKKWDGSEHEIENRGKYVQNDNDMLTPNIGRNQMESALKRKRHDSNIGSTTPKLIKSMTTHSTSIRHKGKLTKVSLPNNRKRSAEPRPHPTHCLNKRYWDEVRAGRIPASIGNTSEGKEAQTTALSCTQSASYISHNSKARRSSEGGLPQISTENFTIRGDFGPRPSILPQTKLNPRPEALPSRISMISPRFPPPLHLNLPFPPAPFLLPPPTRTGLDQPALPPPPAFIQQWLQSRVQPPANPIPNGIHVVSTTGQSCSTDKFMSIEETTNRFLQIVANTQNCRPNATPSTSTLPDIPRLTSVRQNNQTPSDEYVDLIVDSMLLDRHQKYDIKTNSPQVPNADSTRESRLCIVPVPIPIFVPFPLTADFIRRHYSAKCANSLLRC
ncbi:hypothetical protein DdX_02991 [Ditylenchus destructor]|uniref:Uncharacterized protein n=1 Tax=Ditylenchus destructor TaxID=166010 RepID=A0AAD4NC80_9BILA|nr:hypothetical protein DdX_02991 [Ditylenchus destructor]